MRNFKKGCAALFSTMLLCAAVAVPLTASATTVDDVIAAAYAAGIPEQYIQEGIATYSGGNYTSEQCDAAIAYIYSYQADVDQKIEETLNPGGSSEQTTTAAPAQTTPQTTQQQQIQQSPVEQEEAPAVENAAPEEQTPAAPTISKEEQTAFINMTLEEKIEYVSNMPPEIRSEYIGTLTTEQRNSIVKQLSVEDKAEILNQFLNVGDALGLNLTVDEMTENNIVISARNQDGQLVDVSTLGISVENTGYSYTMPILVAVGLAVIGVGGIAGLMLSAKKKQATDFS